MGRRRVLLSTKLIKSVHRLLFVRRRAKRGTSYKRAKGGRFGDVPAWRKKENDKFFKSFMLGLPVAPFKVLAKLLKRPKIRNRRRK